MRADAPHHRRKVLFLRGFQLRFAALVAGSLIVLLLFTGLHGLYVAQLVLPPDVSQHVRPVFESSTWRVFLIGLAYIMVVTVAAVFLSHRAVGPIARLEDEIRKLMEDPDGDRKLRIREGDELSGLADAINNLLEKESQPGHDLK